MKYFLIFILMNFITAYSQGYLNKDLSQKVSFSECSDCSGLYNQFNSCLAINEIIDIENTHILDISNGLVSRYYGTLWREQAESIKVNDTMNTYQLYINSLDKSVIPDSLHCTIYAYKALKAGFSSKNLEALEKYYKNIWKSREIAGWSIGYILVTKLKWKAYLIIHPNSSEYKHCLKNYTVNKSYPVWRQPNIPLNGFLEVGKDDEQIEKLLKQNEFGWGFSEQGIHTWVTRYNQLKECNWLGSPIPNQNVELYTKPLFITTNFKDYHDYDSHVIIFPSEGY